MKKFQTLVDETLQCEDLEELEAAADLFQFGIEKGYYDKSQANEFNTVYWKVKNKYLTHVVLQKLNGNFLDVSYIVSNAPAHLKDNEKDITDYVAGRIKALKGKIGGLK